MKLEKRKVEKIDFIKKFSQYIKREMSSFIRKLETEVKHFVGGKMWKSDKFPNTDNAYEIEVNLSDDMYQLMLWVISETIKDNTGYDIQNHQSYVLIRNNHNTIKISTIAGYEEPSCILHSHNVEGLMEQYMNWRDIFDRIAQKEYYDDDGRFGHLEDMYHRGEFNIFLPRPKPMALEEKMKTLDEPADDINLDEIDDDHTGPPREGLIRYVLGPKGGGMRGKVWEKLNCEEQDIVTWRRTNFEGKHLI